MLYITGDIHGEVGRLERMAKEYALTARDTLIIAGDFGCIFGLRRLEDAKLDVLEKLPYRILFVDGNHENFPRIFSYPEEMWNGGRVHRIRPNILHLMRGQVYELEGKTIFTMGGGYSLDKGFRTPGKSWWPEELPSEEEYAEAWENLHRHGDRVDIMISHAAPAETMEMLLQTGVFHTRVPEEMRLNFFLEEVRQKVMHDAYYFGHLHLDRKLFRRQTALYYDVYDLLTGERVEPVISCADEQK